MALAILLAVVGASAEHGTGAPQLRRGPASVVLSVLFTLAGLAGVGSLALLFWGLVTRNRRKPRRLGASAALPDPGRGGGLGYLRLPDRTVSARRPRATPSVPTGIGRKTAVQRWFSDKSPAVQHRRVLYDLEPRHRPRRPRRPPRDGEARALDGLASGPAPAAPPHVRRGHHVGRWRRPRARARGAWHAARFGDRGRPGH